ncbi:uncharacterized protein [Spinacia oleracea]|uniref:DUF4283 domain-containing protein n=1 Tax=Spinacia oleracea TaxID=3562 RepID=A0ABM3R3F2_SPIOL|nr:uncharacterized protein LOC130465414 [Spinacia oleracea]
MADDLTEKWSNLNLEDEDNDVVDLGGIELTDEDDRVSLMLVGKLVIDLGFNVDACKKTMIQAWLMKGKVVIRAIGENLFVFQFFHWRDEEKVMSGRPWCFEQNLLLLHEISGNEQPNKVVLTHSPFWVRIENLPFNCRSDAHVKAITPKLGELMEIEEDLLGIEKDRRLRVMMDVTKPLLKFVNVVNREGAMVKVKLKYES